MLFPPDDLGGNLFLSQPAPQGWIEVTGKIRATTYHGATTRYAVTLDGGGELAVMRENAGSGGAGVETGDAVRLAWPRHLNQALAEGA